MYIYFTYGEKVGLRQGKKYSILSTDSCCLA